MNKREKRQTSSSFRHRRGIIFFLPLLLSLNFLLTAGPAIADGIGGYLDLNYSNSATETADETGETSTTKSAEFNQLYNLTLKRTIYPNVFLNAGGIFEKSTTNSSIDGEDITSSTTKLRPSVDLTMKNQVFTLGGRYNIREERTTGSDALTVTNVNENRTIIFGWKPEGFPSLDMRIERTNLFDRDRLNQDTATDFLGLMFQYAPEYGYLKGLDIRYQPSYSKIHDKLDDITTKDLTHNGRLTYADTFFNKRVSLFMSDNISYTVTEVTTSSSTAEVSTQLFPFAGLSAIDDSPGEGALDLNGELIDGNLTSGTGINIGLPPASGGDTRPRNIGLDFAAGSEVNSVLVWVDRELPAQIAGSFSWDIYTSTDNQTWTLLTTVPLAPFGPFQNRFEINFSQVTARYIKVVTKPLEISGTLGVPGDFSNIFITEIQAFLKKSSGEFGRKVKDTRTSNIYNLDVKTKILDVPSLFYEFSYYVTKVASSFTNSTLSNGLSASHSFSSIVSAQARAAREDTVIEDKKGATYLYNASITARPLKTLSHTLNYSGQIEETDGEKGSTNALFLNNVAELYKGININVNAGASVQKKDTGEKTTNTVFSVGSGIVPHKRITFDLYYSGTNTKHSGGDLEELSDFSHRGTFGVSYKPVDTVYILASVEIITERDDSRNLQNFGANWSPFPDGSLQFTFSYNESLTSDGDKIRLMNPSARWNISRRAFLDLSSQFIRSESVSQTADSLTSSATLRMVF
jgi:hypothetical protein